MNQENRALADILRKELQANQTNYLVKIESERKLAERLSVGRQRIREVINQLVSEGLLIKYEGKGTYIAPIVRNRYVNLMCSPSIKSNDPFYNKILMELTSYAARNCVNMISIKPNMLMNGIPDSPLLLIGRFEDETLESIKSVYKMIISFENYPEHDDFTQIYFDHFRIGMNAAKVLAEYGHKRVIHLTGPDKYASACYRKNGFLRGSRKNGIENVVLEGKMNFQGGYDLGKQVAELIRRRKFTAVFAANDWMAVGLIQALKAEGINVPEDVSTLSVDNISLASQMYPNLTTYSLDANIMIAECFSLINTMLPDADEKTFHKRIILQPVLVARDSLKMI